MKVIRVKVGENVGWQRKLGERRSFSPTISLITFGRRDFSGPGLDELVPLRGGCMDLTPATHGGQGVSGPGPVGLVSQRWVAKGRCSAVKISCSFEFTRSADPC